MKKLFFFTLISCLGAFAKPLVTTTILPTKYFVERIAGDSLEVVSLVEKGADPHTYEPKPNQMKSVEKSELHFAVGMEFDEIWLPRLQKQFPNLVVINTDENIKKIPMMAHHHHDHDSHDHESHADHNHHDDQGVIHDHGGADPHIWLDPSLVKKQAVNIANALIKKYPKNKELFESNLNKFNKDLDSFDKNTAEKLKNLKSNKFMVYHPSWGYFAARYNLVQIPIEIEGKEPKPADLKELINKAKDEEIKVIFVAPQFSKKAANMVAKQTGAEVVEIDQLPENWFSEMQKTVDIFAKILK
ncbi:metal ABC transporter solute-binding protein, Zn/Mn family [Campylobacter ureolyticus]|uniref:metal ABC transporter solute-binding protein, Zn/Mn family n=1 Tax=Campylobacter ureolyticus TaxID=827 RepID=UPI0026F047CB|nr:zinc ABC transporter substrate-binding protein [Campylobacter ureolyticus]